MCKFCSTLVKSFPIFLSTALARASNWDSSSGIHLLLVGLKPMILNNSSVSSLSNRVFIWFKASVAMLAVSLFKFVLIRGSSSSLNWVHAAFIFK